MSTYQPISNRVFIANRGEIACRIARTLNKLGYESVGLVLPQHEPSGMQESLDIVVTSYDSDPLPYLDIDSMIETALAHRCKFIHPGYGFLSENPDFAKRIQEAGLVFIGPSHYIIKLMADKVSAKGYAQKNAVPILEQIEVSDIEKVTEPDLLSMTSCLTYPLLVKAAYGGGGRGMRQVHSKEELMGALQSAAKESKRHFNSSKVFIEPYIEKARHIEVQVAGDAHGNFFHIFDRECSIQRRHQKVIEECPANIDKNLRQKILETTVNGFRNLGYQGVGTVEYILTADGNFYFLEMNTRLQVEHCVTEEVCGIDLVALQMDIAEGKDISKSLNNISISGHAIQARIYAEEPHNQFTPHPGRVMQTNIGKITNSKLRCDHAFGNQSSSPISPLFDPMIAKVIAKGAHREPVTHALCNALDDLFFVGVAHNLGYLRKVLSHADFSEIRFHTQWLEAENKSLTAYAKSETSDLHRTAIMSFVLVSDANIPYGTYSLMSPLSKRTYPLKLKNLENSEMVTVNVIDQGHDTYTIIYEDKSSVEITAIFENNLLRIEPKVGSRSQSHSYAVYRKNRNVSIDANGVAHLFSLISYNKDQADSDPYDNHIYMPLDGKLVKSYVNNGDKVAKGALLFVVEAMKMEHSLKAKFDGTISRFDEHNKNLRKGELLCTLDKD